MELLYSQSTQSCYVVGHHEALPADAVSITMERYQQVIASPASGKVRGHDASGLPILIDPPIHVPTDDDHRAAVAARRYLAEVAGITVDGMAIDTGRDSQALITGAALAAMLDPAYACRWKTPAGFVELTAEQIIAVAQAVRAHVQAAFDREAELLGAIVNGTYTAAMLEEGWPNEQVPGPAAG